MNSPLPISRRGFNRGLVGAALAARCGAAAGAEPAERKIRIAVRDSARKWLRSESVAMTDLPPSFSLHAARNETEAFQIGLQATRDTLENVRVTLEPALGPDGKQIKPEDIDLFRVQWFAIDAPSDTFGRAGFWPDPLVRFNGALQVAAAAPTVLWVRVNIRADTTPGSYRGRIVVEAAGETQTIEWSVQVYGVVLPAEMTLPFLVGLDWESIRRLETGATPERFSREVAPRYLSTLREAGAVPFNPFESLAALPDDPAASIDFEGIDRRLQETAAFHASGAPVPVPFALNAPVDTKRFPLFSPAWRSRTLAYLRAVARHYEALGLMERSFIYVAEADEPTRSAQVERIVELHRLAAEADPRFKVVQTIHARCFDCKEPMLRTLESPNTQWVPNIAFYDGRALAGERTALGKVELVEVPSEWKDTMDWEVRQSGRQVWWYFNASTTVLRQADQPQYPSLNIDHDAMAHRVIGWIAWNEQIAAVGHWMATYWRGPTGPWEVVPRGQGGTGTNGDGVLLYPGRGAPGAPSAAEGPMPSIRFEMMRESGEDHKLLTLAKRRLGREATRALSKNVHNGLHKFPLDPAPMREARIALLTELSR